MKKRFFIILIQFYQKYISCLIGSNCRFYPSCSQYSNECFERFSITKAIWYTIIRILKCHPFHPGGIDEVPPQQCCSIIRRS